MATQADDFQELQQIALRMRREMPLKERTIHLQTFKWTFHGQQAVSFLVSAGIAPDAHAAAELCQQLLQHGLCKSVYHKEVFTPDSEVYRFSSSMLDNKHKGLTSLTSTGLYKEIAKFGKAAAQPFKNVQVSLNDTLATLGGLSAVAPKLGSSNNSSSNATSANGNHPGHTTSGRLAKLPTRRSLAGKREGLPGNSSISPADSLQDSLAGVIAELQALQAAYKESNSLMRLDLQQHTALQEHMVGLLMAQQAHNQRVQVFAAVAAAAASLLLVVSSAATSAWPVQLLGGLLLGVILLLGLPHGLSLPAVGVRAKQGIAAGILGRAAGAPAASALETCMPLSQTARSVPPLDTTSAQMSVVAEAGSCATSTATDEESGSDMVEGDWEECGPCLDDFDDWPDAPCMLCPDPAVTKQVFAADSVGPCQALPLNSAPIPFESELFSGVVVVYVRHLPTTPLQLFKGKKRLIWVALQGTFKRAVSMDSLVFGQEFSHKLCNLPAPWFIDNMLLPLARKISPALRVGNLEQPYLYSPLITASQVVNVSQPGAVPPLMEAKEDISLLAASLGRQPGDLGTVSARRKHFQSAAHRSAASFGPGHVWTFHLWQEYVDYASYMLNLSYSSYDLTQHLDGQPLQVMVKDVSNSTYLVNLQVWHSNLVRSSQRHFTRQPTRPRAGRDRSTQVTEGGVAPDQEAFAPNDTQQGARISDASTAEFGHQQLVEQQQLPQQLQGQGQHSSTVSASGDALVEEASSPHSEHWFDARYSQTAQDVPPGNEQQQQQHLGQQQQQQQQGLVQQTVAHVLPEQQQPQQVLPLQQVWQRMQSGTSASSPISPVSASGSLHTAAMARAGAAVWGQGPGAFSKDDVTESMRSGMSASAMMAGDATPNSSGALKSMRSL